MPGDRIDSLARVLGRPMPRRQMLRLSAGALAGAAVAPAALANRALGAERPKNCQEYCSRGTPCPGNRPRCCCVNSSVTQGAYVVPLGGACYDPEETLCCPVKRPDGSQSVVKCDALREACGQGGGGPNCICLVDCGGDCCYPLTQECGKERGECLEPCPPGWTGDEYTCCPPPLAPDGKGECLCKGRDKCGSGCCPLGETCLSGRLGVCVGPPPGDDFLPTFGGPFPSLPRGVSAAAGPFARSTAAGPLPILVALSSIAAQRAAALDLFGNPGRDRAFRRRVRVPRATIAVGGLPAPARPAVDRLLKAEAKANARLLAAGRARARSLGALRARRRRSATLQARYSGRLAASAAKSYRGLPARRAAAARALRAAGVREVHVSLQQAVATRQGLAGGLPPSLSVRRSASD